MQMLKKNDGLEVYLLGNGPKNLKNRMRLSYLAIEKRSAAIIPATCHKGSSETKFRYPYFITI